MHELVVATLLHVTDATQPPDVATEVEVARTIAQTLSDFANKQQSTGQLPVLLTKPKQLCHQLPIKALLPHCYPMGQSQCHTTRSCLPTGFDHADVSQTPS